MEKLQSEHITPYLPYKLMFLEIRSGRGRFENDVSEQAELHVGNINGLLNGKIYRVKSRKIILRPLSDLTKDEDFYESFMDEFSTNDNNLDYLCESKRDITKYSELGYNCIMFLIEHHFDVFGLIEKGLAIDKNTVK